jgi:peptide/nickel transport system ATP-binding protein
VKGRALALHLHLIVADEPVSMVDASLRATILGSLRQLNQERGISIIYITHDLATAYQVADNIIVLYRASVAEAGDVELVVKAPEHPYTQLLIASVPQVSVERSWLNEPAAGHQEGQAVGGCKFISRCPFAMGVCQRSVPPLFRTEPRRVVACHQYAASGAVQPEAMASVFAGE